MTTFTYNDRIEKIAREARDAKTNDELTVACQKLNVADLIFLDRVDIWLAKFSLSAVYRTLKKYPELRDNINYFGTLKGFIQNKDALFAKLNKAADAESKMMIKNNTDDLAKNCRQSFEGDGLATAFYAYATRGQVTCGLSGIIMNGKSLSQQNILEDLKYGESAGHSPQGCKSVRSLIDHEIGHIFDNRLGIKNCREFQDFIRKYDAESIKKGLSGYCVMNNEIAYAEDVAEGYSEYCNNPKPREIASKIGQLIEAKYKETFKR